MRTRTPANTHTCKHTYTHTRAGRHTSTHARPPTRTRTNTHILTHTLCEPLDSAHLIQKCDPLFHWTLHIAVVFRYSSHSVERAQFTYTHTHTQTALYSGGRGHKWIAFHCGPHRYCFIFLPTANEVHTLLSAPCNAQMCASKRTQCVFSTKNCVGWAAGTNRCSGGDSHRIASWMVLVFLQAQFSVYIIAHTHTRTH